MGKRRLDDCDKRIQLSTNGFSFPSDNPSLGCKILCFSLRLFNVLGIPMILVHVNSIYFRFSVLWPPIANPRLIFQ